MKSIKSDEPAIYAVEHIDENISGKEICNNIINQAVHILEARMRQPGALIENPEAAQQYFFLELAEEQAELFCVLFLDNRHRAITMQRMFAGTIDGASVHPREVVRAAINHNAAAVILAHNHPSGDPEPSRADISITKRLTETLALIDCRVLDHHIIGRRCTQSVSMAERGLL